MRLISKILVASVLLGSLGAAGGIIAAQAPATTQTADRANTITVKDVSGLNAALAAAVKRPGETILLAPGTYSGLYAKNFTLQGVTIASADPSHPAILTGFWMDAMSGLTFSNLVFSTEGSQDAYPFRVGNSNHITYANLSVHGSLNGNPADDQSGIFMRYSDHIIIKNSEFQQLANAIVPANATDILVDGNFVHDVGQDGVHANGVSTITVSNNRFSDFRPDGRQHPDAIQFFTANTTEAAHDIIIVGNLYDRGKGQPVQGVFMSDESGAGYKAVTIASNTVIGAIYNGIGIGSISGLTLDGNTVIPLPDQQSWITVRGGDKVVATGNRATKLSFIDIKPIEKGSVAIDVPRDKGAAAIAAWVAKHPGAQYGPVAK